MIAVPRNDKTVHLEPRALGNLSSETVHVAAQAAFRVTAKCQLDPPPLKWSDSKYGFLPEEDCNAEEETQA